MKSTVRFRLSVAALALAGSALVAIAGPTMSLEATSINGVDLTNAPTQQIEAYPGDVIVAKIYISDWSPQGQKISAYQAQVEPIDFRSGTSGRIVPFDYDDARAHQIPNRHHAFIDQTEATFIHRRLNTLAITDSISLGYRWASVLLDALPGPSSPQDGEKYYAGTLHLQVSNDAAGDFKLGFIETPESCGMRDSIGTSIAPIEFRPLTISVHSADIVQLIGSLNGLASPDMKNVDMDGDGVLRPNDVGSLIHRFNRPDGEVETAAD